MMWRAWALAFILSPGILLFVWLVLAELRNFMQRGK